LTLNFTNFLSATHVANSDKESQRRNQC